MFWLSTTLTGVGTKNVRLRSNTGKEGQNNVTHLGTRFVQPEAPKARSADRWRVCDSLRLRSHYLAAAVHGGTKRRNRNWSGRLGSGFVMATKFVTRFVAGQKTTTCLLPALCSPLRPIR